MNYVNGKKIIITGATSGVGKATAKELARQGAEIIIVARNPNKIKSLSSEIEKITGKSSAFYLADLSKMQEVKKAAEQIKADYPAIDMLINNAGLVMNKRETTEDGFEYTLAVNHLAPFLLTNLLFTTLEAANEAKIINVSSEAHKMGRDNLQDFNYENSKYKPMRVYGDTKLYNILFTNHLAVQLNTNNVNVYCLHPGFVNSNFGHNLGIAAEVILFFLRPFMISAEKGARTSIDVANLPFGKKFKSVYFKSSKPKKTSSLANDKQLAEQLWLKTKSLLEPWM